MKACVGNTITAAVLGCLGVLTTNCTLIGYGVGSAIDRPRPYEVDSLKATQVSDGSRLDPVFRTAINADSLAALLKKISVQVDRQTFKDDQFVIDVVPAPDRSLMDSVDDVKIQIVTRYSPGRYAGDVITLDTVVAVKIGPEGGVALFTDEDVVLKMNGSVGTEVRGSVVRLSERNIALHISDRDQGYPLKSVDSVFLANGLRLAVRDLGTSRVAPRFINVARLTFNSSPKLVIPLDEVDEVKVKVLKGWGKWKTILTVTGAAVDTGVLIWVVSRVGPWRPYEGLPSGGFFGL